MTRSAPVRLSAWERGFTLLELMVVVIIVGVITSLAVLSLGDNVARQLDKEAYRFASLIRMAADEAVLQGHEIGLEVKRDGYAFHQFDDQFRQWVPMAGSPIYRPRTLIEGMTLDLLLDDEALILPGLDNENDEEQKDPPQPQVLMLSSGEITPFEVIFEFQDLDVVLTATSNGTVEQQAN